MLSRLRHRWSRRWAVLQCAALLVWSLGSAVWAYAPNASVCPMTAALMASTAAVAEAPLPSCCAAQAEAAAPVQQPAPHCPDGKSGHKCCCPVVAPAIPDAGLLTLPTLTMEYRMLFAEPIMIDRLAPRVLIIPPTC